MDILKIWPQDTNMRYTYAIQTWGLSRQRLEVPGWDSVLWFFADILITCLVKVWLKVAASVWCRGTSHRLPKMFSAGPAGATMGALTPQCLKGNPLVLVEDTPPHVGGFQKQPHCHNTCAGPSLLWDSQCFAVHRETEFLQFNYINVCGRCSSTRMGPESSGYSRTTAPIDWLWVSWGENVDGWLGSFTNSNRYQPSNIGVMWIMWSCWQNSRF